MNHFKMKSKLIIGVVVVFLIFTLVPTVVAAKSTKLAFNSIEFLDPSSPTVPPPTIMFVEDGVFHIKDFWTSHLLEGLIENDEITGYTISLFHFKQDLATGNIVLNGKSWFYFTWGDSSGYFTGTVNVKMMNGIIDGKFTLQGFGDFEGMKLFGEVEGIDAITNGLYGTILIPN